ncbi:hypothetical protein AB6Q56_14585 [Dechloromonas sp. ARDL1]|uniref:hypothetical protein n=1 Tax=Dechloromonas sp. ARDL1 TaxID=3322121 RepID=UPI003DA6EB99
MQRAADKFERKDPFPNIPFSVDELEMVPSFMEVVGWIFLAFLFFILCIGFLGIA